VAQEVSTYEWPAPTPARNRVGSNSPLSYRLPVSMSLQTQALRDGKAQLGAHQDFGIPSMDHRDISFGLLFQLVSRIVIAWVPDEKTFIERELLAAVALGKSQAASQ